MMPKLIVDDCHPGRIILDEKEIRLQHKTFLLIRVLASSPGQCISYKILYDAIWKDVIVESNQLHYQKNKLLRCVPQYRNLITTIPKSGFVLNLDEDEVELNLVAPLTRTLNENTKSQLLRMQSQIKGMLDLVAKRLEDE